MWIDLELFTAVIESLQPSFQLTRFLSSVRIEQSLKNNILEVLFFFRLFQTFEENSLSNEEIELVFAIALKDCPPTITKEFSNIFFDNLSKTVITFDEFYIFILRLM